MVSESWMLKCCTLLEADIELCADEARCTRSARTCIPTDALEIRSREAPPSTKSSSTSEAVRDAGKDGDESVHSDGGRDPTKR